MERQEKLKGDRYIIVFQYEYAKEAIEVAKLAIDIINSLIDKRKNIAFNDRLSIIKDIIK